jgi:hypothetical protein
MSDEEMPKDPLVGYKESAIHLHELYTSYVAAGFTNEQAFGLVCLVLQTTITNMSNGGG